MPNDHPHHFESIQGRDARKLSENASSEDPRLLRRSGAPGSERVHERRDVREIQHALRLRHIRDGVLSDERRRESLHVREVEHPERLKEVGDAIERLHQEHDYTFCMIEHDLEFISRLCDPVIVMAEGEVLTQGTADEVKENEAVIEAYLGAGMKRQTVGT